MGYGRGRCGGGCGGSSSSSYRRPCGGGGRTRLYFSLVKFLVIITYLIRRSGF